MEPPTSPRFVEFLAALHIYNHASSPVISIQFDENMDGVSKFMIRFVKFNARVGLPMRILLRFFRAAREEELGKKKKEKKKRKKKKKKNSEKIAPKLYLKLRKEPLDVANYFDVVYFIPLLTLNSSNTSKGAARLQSPQEK